MEKWQALLGEPVGVMKLFSGFFAKFGLSFQAIL
jgi:hypothetical protein